MTTKAYWAAVQRARAARERDYLRGIRHVVEVWPELARRPWR